MNLEGVHNAFEAARQAGVRKVVFTSTGQTVLYYPKGEWVTPEMPPRPWTVYACHETFWRGAGAALLGEARDVDDCDPALLVSALRERVVAPNPATFSVNGAAPRDLTQLLVKSLRCQVPFAIFFGVSNNTGRFWDIGNAQRLVGYEPQDNAADYV